MQKAKAIEPTIVAVRIVETKHVELFQFDSKANALEFENEIITIYGDEVEVAHTVSKIALQ